MPLATYDIINETCLAIIATTYEHTPEGAALRLLYNTGLRVEEAVELTRYKIDVDTFTVETQKGSYPRTFSLELLPAYYRDLLPLSPLPYSRQTVSSTTTLQRTIVGAPVRTLRKNKKQVTTNLFRYRYAQMLLGDGYNLEQIKEEMGHISLTSTQSYLMPLQY